MCRSCGKSRNIRNCVLWGRMTWRHWNPGWRNGAWEGYRLIRFKGLYGIFHWEGNGPCRYRLQPLLEAEMLPETGDGGDLSGDGVGVCLYFGRCLPRLVL